MNLPTPEQQAILDAEERLRIVEAAPGSGKTWLVARKLEDALSKWPHTHRGIAALSFTNVARDEIHSALGIIPGHPHFIGTLDSFIFRYIVRPFCHLFDRHIRKVTLIPGDFAAALAAKQQWAKKSNLTVQIGSNAKTRVNVFVATFLAEKEGQACFMARKHPQKPPEVFDGGYATSILEHKRKVWCDSGRVSHSDAVYIAYELLKGRYGEQILRQLLRRFPALVVDELQDTGWYMGQILHRILGRKDSKGLIVGDPDQAIFEFGGATPALFPEYSQLDGARVYEMRDSRRCPEIVCNVALHLASSGRSLNGRETGGRAILATYSGDGLDTVCEFSRLLEKGMRNAAVMVRKNLEMERLDGSARNLKVKLSSRPLARLYGAVHHLRGGRNTRALALAESVLARVILGSDHVEEETLADFRIFSSEWRRTAVALLLYGYRVVDDESLFDWCQRQITWLQQLVLEKGWKFSKTRMPRRPKEAARSEKARPDPSTSRGVAVPCLTVHGAKGKTYDTAILFLPKLSEDKCPSVYWWQDGSEERRIAYVAATRAREVFVLCVHDETFKRLEQRRPEFVAAFEVRRLEEIQPDW